MSETEIIKLNAWIAENVMGWRIFSDGRGNLCASIGGYLYLSGCDLKGITIPKKFNVIK